MSANKIDPKVLAKYIDHTMLKPDASLSKIGMVCDEAKKYGFATVCVNPCYIKYVSERLRGSGIAPCTVIGFPLGATLSEVKACETAKVIAQGAKEIDMVINIGAAKTGDWDLVQKDIKAVIDAAAGNALVKVIIEACLLTDEEKEKACKAAKSAGADFVKTSTGFSTGGANVEDVRLMRRAVGTDVGVKAAGGIRDLKTVVDMINAGATRIGTSAGVSIMIEASR